MTTHELLLAAKAAAPALAWLGSEEKNAAILRMADAIVRETDVILAANEADVQAAKGTISDVMLDRRLARRRPRVHETRLEPRQKRPGHVPVHEGDLLRVAD